MKLHKLMLAIGAGVVIGGSALAAPKAPAPQKVEVINMVQTSEVAKAEKPDPTTVPCDPPKDVRTSDLCAQWKAADAARDAANWTFWAFVVGTLVNVATLIFVGLTFREARRSTEAAAQSAAASEVSAKAAVDAAVGAGELLKADRAWMTTVSPDVRCLAAFDGAKVLVAEIAVQMLWTNTGRSPALNFRANTEIGWIAANQEIRELPNPIKEDAGLSIGVGSSYGPAFGEVDVEDVKKFVRGEIDFYAYSSCEYEDVFHPGVIRRSAACFRLIALYPKAKHGKVAIQVYQKPIGRQNFAE